MFHVEHPTFSTIMFFLVFSSVFQAAQERIPIAGFSACGIIPFRRMAIPAERFLCRRTALSYGIKDAAKGI